MKKLAASWIALILILTFCSCDHDVYEIRMKTNGDVLERTLRASLSSSPSQATMGRLDTLLDKINSGQGTLGQLLVNPSLYQNLDSTTREVNGLMKDFRTNPKKFLRIKLAIF